MRNGASGGIPTGFVGIRGRRRRGELQRGSRPADPNRRGYIVDPHDTLVIDGFRTSDANVAAFRFGRVSESYAAKSSGDRNVGVVGLAIFSERGAVWTVGELHTRDTANPFPSRGYAVPPR